jgi:aspartate carbamoyltransferase regulatory subunit
MTTKKPRTSMSVTAIRQGTVLDHIPSGATFKVADILQLADEDDVVLVGMNLAGSRAGRKGIIKVENRELTGEEVDKIALIAPQATLNIIKGYEVVEKRAVQLPDRVEDIVRCFNPNCVTNRQQVPTVFDVLATTPPTLRCTYCERTMSGPDVILK